jgi:hypothetical protein
MEKDLKEIINETKNKLVLLKMKDILLKEYQKSYYNNGANISEIIDLGSYNVLNNDTERIDRINNMAVYNNGFVVFNNFERSIKRFSR